jgi:uncharacterized integral membrane protein
MHYVTTGLAVIALLAFIAFAVQNLQAVEISFLMWSTEVSKCMLIIGAFLLGVVSGWGMLELRKFYQG